MFDGLHVHLTDKYVITFFWGYLTSKVCTTKSRRMDDRKQRIWYEILATTEEMTGTNTGKPSTKTRRVMEELHGASQ